MSSIISGTYEMVSSDKKYSDFLKAFGVSLLNRTLAVSVKPTMIYSEENGKWIQKTLSVVKNLELVFISGVPFEEVLADGRKCEALVTIEGNKLTHRLKTGDYSCVVIREFGDDGMVSTYLSGNVVATRVFKRVA